MAEARVERRLAAILAADVAGYSRLMGVDEEGTLAALKAYRGAARISHVCDVGSNILIKFSDAAGERLNAPIAVGNAAGTIR